MTEDTEGESMRMQTCEARWKSPWAAVTVSVSQQDVAPHQSADDCPYSWVTRTPQ